MRRCLYFIILIWLCAGCEDYFTSSSDSTYPEDVVFSNVDFAAQSVIGVYAAMCDDNLYSKKLSLYFSMNTDVEYISGATDNGRRGIAHYMATSSNTEIYGPWSSLYSAIERVNCCIFGIRKSPVFQEGNKTERQQMNRLLGEALTLRAILYFDLVKNWGDVPYKTEPMRYGDSLSLPKTDRRIILDGILKDLQNAEPLVGWMQEYGTNERINKGFIKGFIARVALFQGGFSISSENNENMRPENYLDYYKLANEYCWELIESGQHSLNYSFSDIYKTQCTYTKDVRYGEPMFELAFGRLNRGELGYYLGVKHEENEKYGKSEAGMYAPPSFFYSFDPSDLRRDVTCAYHKYTSKGEQELTAITNLTIAKWRKEWIKPAITGSAKYTGVNFTFLRYSDVLLMYAETENELNNGPSDAALKAFKEVRKRAFPDSLYKIKVEEYVNSLTDKESFFLALVNERAWEFAGESIRKYDLIRWGLLKKKLNQCKADLEKIRIEESPFEDVPDKVYWRLPKDEEVIIVANIDKKYGNPDFDMSGCTATQWRSKLNSTYINRVAEGDPDLHQFLPIPQKAVDDSNGLLINDYGY